MLAWWIDPLVELIAAHVVSASVIHADDTPIKVLAPGRGRTVTGRLWIYVVDQRPWCGDRAPAALFRYSPDRKGERPQEHLADFKGFLHADAYAGYKDRESTARRSSHMSLAWRTRAATSSTRASARCPPWSYARA